MAIKINGVTVIADTQAITTTSTISATGNVTAGNVTTAGSVNVNGVTLAAAGSNLTIGGNTVVTANATGTSSTTGNVTISGNVTGGNIATAGTVSATGNITGNYIIGNGSQLTGLPAGYTNANLATLGSNVISTTGTITGGNITGANILTGGNVSATGNVTGNYLLGNAYYVTGLSPTQIYNGTSNVTVPSTNGNVAINVGSKNWTYDTTGNLAVPSGTWINTPVGSNGNINIHPDGTGQINVQGGAFGALIFVASDTADAQNRIEVDTFGTANTIGGTFTGRFARGTVAAPAAVQAGDQLAAFKGKGYDGTAYTNPQASVTIDAAGNWSSGNTPTHISFFTTPIGSSTQQESVRINNNGNVSVVGNVVGANFATVGAVSATGNITGSYIIGNGSQLTGLPAGYTNANLATLGSNNVSTTGTVTASSVVGGVITGSSASVTGAVTAASTVGGVITGTSTSVTGTQTAASTVGGVITGSSASVTGAVSGASASVSGGVTAASVAGGVITGTSASVTGAVTGASLVGTITTASQTNITSVGTLGALSVTGTATTGNVATGGTVSATGNVTGGNVIGTTAVVVPTVRNTSALTISTSSGNLQLQPTGNIVVNSTYINGVSNPVQAQDVATKAYVDTFATTGIAFHSPVTAATNTTLATATGGTITYTQPNGAGNGVGALLTTTGAFNLIDTANVQTVGTRILVKNEANAVYNGVYTWANATNIVRSTDTDEYGADSTEALSINDYFFTTGGNVNAGTAFVVNSPAGTITFGTSLITFTTFSTSQVYTANTAAGISLNGTVISAKVDGTTTAFDGSGNISIKSGAALTTPNIGVATGTSLSVTGAVTAASTVGGVITGSSASVTGGVTAASVAGGVITGSSASVTGAVSGASASVSGTVTAASTVGGVITGSSASVTGAVTAASTVGGVITGSSASVTGAVTGASLVGTITTASQPNITSVGTLGSLSVTGNITGSYIIGNGSQLTGLPAGYTNANLATLGSNNVSTTGTVTASSVVGGVITGSSASVTGAVTGASLVGTITTASQTNITAIGTLSSLSVSGNITSGNISATNHTGTNVSVTGTVTAASTVGGVITGSSASVTGAVTGASLAGTITTASQTNITAIGTLSSLSVSGNITSGNISATNHTGTNVSVTGTVTAASTVGGVITGSSASVTGAVTGASLVGTITTASQTNITAVGTLTSMTTSGTATVNSANNATAIANGGTNGSGNIGASGATFNTVYAKATTAQYADLAEKYTADAAYAPGTVLVFGGTAEVTVNAVDGDTKVAGVVSTDPGFLMNEGLDTEFTAAVALTGRVPCMVVGPVRKGDLMVAAGLGRARAEADPCVGSVIGKALEDFDGAEGTIEVVVGRF